MPHWIGAGWLTDLNSGAAKFSHIRQWHSLQLFRQIKQDKQYLLQFNCKERLLPQALVHQMDRRRTEMDLTIALHRQRITPVLVPISRNQPLKRRFSTFWRIPMIKTLILSSRRSQNQPSPREYACWLISAGRIYVVFYLKRPYTIIHLHKRLHGWHPCLHSKYKVVVIDV